MDKAERERREAVFAGAKAAVLGSRPQMAEGFTIRRVAAEEFVLCSSSSAPDTPIGVLEAQFLWLVNGERTVGDIINAMADELDTTQAVIAGKAAMAALHTHYVDGVIDELRGL